ncbi:MAG: hypothetical protein OXG35_13040 [Acidobacteria bacterium]|nr:hypothetical protein [Acidobacteriota bacterium]
MTFTETKTLSEALALTADDIEHLVANPIGDTTFYMGSWLKTRTTVDGEHKPCETCLAGIVMIQRFDGLQALKEKVRTIAATRRPDERYPVTAEIMPGDLAWKLTDPAPDEAIRKLGALEDARRGSYLNAIHKGWPRELSDENIAKVDEIPTPVFGSKSQFTASEMLEGVRDLRTTIIPRLRAAGC